MTLLEFIDRHTFWCFAIFVVGWLFFDAIVVNVCNTAQRIAAMRSTASCAETDDESEEETKS